MLYAINENRRWVNASILYEMPDQERNEGCQGHHYEEWQAGNSGCMSRVWDKDVQDREELKPILRVSCLPNRQKPSYVDIWRCTVPKGTIKKLTDRGFGFIKPEQGEDIFFHGNDVEGAEFNSLREGQEVEFEIGQRDGRPRATNVKLAEAQTETQVDDSGDDKGDDDGGDSGG